MSGQLHVSAVLPTRREVPVANAEKARPALDSVRILGGKKTNSPIGNRTTIIVTSSS